MPEALTSFVARSGKIHLEHFHHYWTWYEAQTTQVLCSPCWVVVGKTSSLADTAALVQQHNAALDDGLAAQDKGPRLLAHMPMVLAHRTVLDHGFITLQQVMGSDADIVAAARISVPGQRWTSTDEGLLNYLMKNKHTTPFEQTALKFHIKLPMFAGEQWLRHRTWSYNKVSGRYSEMPLEFYVPAADMLTEQSKSNKQGRTATPIKEASKAQGLISAVNYLAGNTYKMLLLMGVAKELARIVLPASLYTEMIATVDLHNLLHFLELRADPHAQYEIRVYAEAIIEMIRPHFPVTLAAFEKLRLPPAGPGLNGFEQLRQRQLASAQS